MLDSVICHHIPLCGNSGRDCHAHLGGQAMSFEI